LESSTSLHISIGTLQFWLNPFQALLHDPHLHNAHMLRKHWYVGHKQLELNLLNETEVKVGTGLTEN